MNGVDRATVATSATQIKTLTGGADIVSIQPTGGTVIFNETGNLELNDWGTSYTLQPNRRAVFKKYGAKYALIGVRR